MSCTLGIQFVKRLKLLNDRNKQRAEVAAYFRRFDEAETIFLNVRGRMHVHTCGRTCGDAMCTHRLAR